MMAENLPFAKIPIDISFTSRAKKGSMTIQYGAISYYHVLGFPFPFDKLKILRPNSIRFVEIVGNNQVNPHVDHSITTALNCYFVAGGAITHFWRPLPTAKPSFFPGASSANLYKTGGLELIGSFTAFDGEAYLLDVTTIHSVERAAGSIRQFIQLAWNTASFADVKNRLESL
jgi:hypothetical protein